MRDRYEIELEPEVREWLDLLPDRHYGHVMRVADRLADAAETLGEPLSRHLRGPVRELRFDLDKESYRVSYWLAPNRRVVLLTVFRKTKMRESKEVERAVAAQAECAANHDIAHETYDRPAREPEEA